MGSGSVYTMDIDTRDSGPVYVDDREFKNIPIEKYVLNGIEKDHEKRMHLMELEKRRRKECELNGKKHLFKVSSFSKDESGGGNAMSALVYPKCDIYASIQCFNTSPYSVSLWSKKKTSFYANFQTSDLYAVIQSIKQSQDYNYPAKIDVPLWGGREIIRFTRVANKEKALISGVRISVINSSLVKKRASDLGIKEHLLTKLPLDGVSIEVSSSAVKPLLYLLLKTNRAVRLQYEIHAQHFATFQIASRKVAENPGYTKEEYYWYVMDAFYALDVKDRNKLPAYYVLRLFLKAYLHEKYSMYYDPFCSCNLCFSGVRHSTKLSHVRQQ